MMHYRTSIQINRPVDHVFTYFTDIDNVAQWVDEVVATRKDSEGPIGLGTVMTESIKNGPFVGEVTWEIVDFEPNRLCTFEAENWFGEARIAYIFEALDAGTQLTADVRASLPGLMRFGRPVVQFLHRTNRNKGLKNIKRILENDLDGDGGLSA